MALTRIYYVKTFVAGWLKGQMASSTITVDDRAVSQWNTDAENGRVFKALGGSDYTIKIVRTEDA